MNRSPLEGVFVALVFIAMFVLGYVLRLPKQKWRALEIRRLVKSQHMPYSLSLRALLIATTLLAVVLGLIMCIR
jgi:hypothetical protein